jgi:hypothetical protein
VSDDAARKVLIRGSLGKLVFYGVPLAEVSTETPRRPRWIEMELYRDWTARDDEGRPLQPVGPAEAAQGYVLHVTGRSVVYHVHESGSCKTGIPVPARRLPGDAEPCEVCRPPALAALADGDLVDTEEDRHAAHLCPDTDTVLTRLRDPRSPARTGPEWLSAPAQRLLQLAAAADEGIADATEVVQWLLWKSRLRAGRRAG